MTIAGELRDFLAEPGRKRQLAVVAGALIALAGAFEAGQLRAGHNALAAGISERRLQRQIAGLETERRELAAKLSKLETDAKVDREAYARVDQQLSELQDKIIEQQEEVAFYRGVVGGPGEGGLKIQDFSLAPTDATGYHLKFVLAQTDKSESEVRGSLQIRVEGLRAGRLVSIDLANLAAGQAVPVGPVAKGGRFTFNFRYFEDVAVDLRLPADFTPQRLVIRVLPVTRGIKDSVESYAWPARASASAAP